jgi:hypothetical protein
MQKRELVDLTSQLNQKAANKTAKPGHGLLSE